ncbi:MAG: Uncharacterized protein XD43_1784 [Thermococcales archaeon 44_46]|jgi:hypothetical protein|uniref:UPF0146 family protein n=1 Tax=Thermococcus TaxID=2263 RepID=UPI0005B25EC6|nr:MULTISPECIES: UPF0146 family protein [Thermococcus]KUJ98552.1 MAG: Uncharacterized protein XD43_1784 [Thermococcales archaeon 44_46]MCA6213880.1 hypothetical protein [Thermococcus bergensis]MPW39696.1 hypothetical protein [Thermococcus sp. 101 C5]HIH72873.1 hypothetical protein [Thermococcaceae archaeon]
MSFEKLAMFLVERHPEGKFVEIGVGFNFKVALKLKELGREVLVVDWNAEAVKKAKELGLEAYVDDVFSPRLEIYRNATAIYSVRPTPEIVEPILKLGKLLKTPVYILPFSLDSMPRILKLENYNGLPVYTWRPYGKDI